jgi:hypothetical protein
MGIAHRIVCAVIPTRGDVAIDNIVEHLCSYPEIAEVRIVKGNTPFNRYVEAWKAPQDIIYTQDDDCITDIRPLLDAYEPGIIVNAMTPEHAGQYRGAQTLIGFGAIFNRGLIDSVLDAKWRRDRLFYRESDRIFATVNGHKTLFPEITILPHAEAPNRMYRQPDHVPSKHAMNLRIYQMTGIAA